MNIPEFLEARIAEDEATAMYVSQYGDTGSNPLFSPARILAECEVKREIARLHSACPDLQRMVWGTITACDTCGDVDDSPEEWPCRTLKAITAIYSSHPGYQQEWATT